jgi:CBS domain-containing protein
MASVGDVMRTDTVTAAPEDTLGETAEKMVDNGVGAAAVRDFGRVIGIITERDLLKAVAGRVHTSEARVREWMTPDPITATPEMDVDEAAQIMVENNFRHMPVCEGDLFVGMLSLRRAVAAQIGAELPAGPEK